MEKIKISNFKVNRAISYTFYQIPKELITNKIFKAIDYGSKILYGLMLNRVSLSAQNPNFIDKNGDVYIIYTVEQVIEDMGCSKPTAVNMLKQLDNIGLIEKRRLGQGKPSIIYVKDFGSIDFQKLKKLTSESKKNELVKVKKFDLSNNYISKNNNRKNDISIYPTQDEAENFDNEPTEPETIDMIDTTKKENIPETVADKICLDEVINENPDKKEKITELYQTICDVLAGHSTDTVRIAKKQIPIDTVKRAFASLGKVHIQYVLECLEKNGGNITNNAKGYIMTALYNSIHSIGYYKPNSESAFADNSKPRVKYSDEILEKMIRKSMKF